MAKQCGPVYFEKAIDDLVFYKMMGEYYARSKSALTAKRVKTSAEFFRTMYSANRMARASRIGSAIYQALPPGWRQFWMFRSFTDEAFSMLKTEMYTEEEVKQAQASQTQQQASLIHQADTSTAAPSPQHP